MGVGVGSVVRERDAWFRACGAVCRGWRVGR